MGASQRMTWTRFSKPSTRPNEGFATETFPYPLAPNLPLHQRVEDAHLAETILVLRDQLLVPFGDLIFIVIGARLEHDDKRHVEVLIIHRARQFRGARTGREEDLAVVLRDV